MSANPFRSAWIPFVPSTAVVESNTPLHLEGRDRRWTSRTLRRASRRTFTHSSHISTTFSTIPMPTGQVKKHKLSLKRLSNLLNNRSSRKRNLNRSPSRSRAEMIRRNENKMNFPRTHHLQENGPKLRDTSKRRRLRNPSFEHPADADLPLRHLTVFFAPGLGGNERYVPPAPCVVVYKSILYLNPNLLISWTRTIQMYVPRAKTDK